MTRLDTPSTDTRIVGRPLDRVDGPMKVTGGATYAYENARIGEALVGVFTTATIGRGEIAAIDASIAEAMPGVRLVITHENVLEQGALDESQGGFSSRARPIMRGRTIHHFGQPVALAIAETFEQARDAALAVAVEYETVPGTFVFTDGIPVTEPEIANVAPAATDRGDFEGGFARAAFRIDQTYETPAHFSQPMEPHATLWPGGRGRGCI